LLSSTVETPPGTGLLAAPCSYLVALRRGEERGWGMEWWLGENQGSFPSTYSTRRGERLGMDGEQLPRPEEMTGERGWGWSTGPLRVSAWAPTRLCLGLSPTSAATNRVGRRKGRRK
jgi:hypothetical protein